MKVSELAALKAEQYKRAKILEGEGNAEKAHLEMQANGALEQKLAAYVEVNKVYAKEFGNYKGNWVPGVIMGSDGKAAQSGGATDMINLLTIKTAKDLELDMTMQANTK